MSGKVGIVWEPLIRRSVTQAPSVSRVETEPPGNGGERCVGWWIVEVAASTEGYSLKDWCWSWSFNTWATSCKEPTHWKRLWFWERLRREGGNRGWHGWITSLTQWTWVWPNSRRWWRKGKPGVPQSMGSQSQMQLSYWTTAPAL